LTESEQERIERIIDGGNPVEIGLLKKEIEHKIDQAHNELFEKLYAMQGRT
jgi:hypothetical protein